MLYGAARQHFSNAMQEPLALIRAHRPDDAVDNRGIGLPKRFLIVTGADEAYAEFAADLISSLEHLQRLEFDVGLLDYGLAPATRTALQRRVTSVVTPPWPFRPNARFDAQIQARAFATRP